MSGAGEFIEVTPTPANMLRGVVLFGRNVASYKFALARSLVELAAEGIEVVSLDQLAEPFARHLCTHLRDSPRQTTSPSSRFLDACRQFNEGSLGADQLRDTTVRLGFNNVIDAFHVVGPADIPIRFFIDERSTSVKGIRLTDDLLDLDTVARSQAVVEIEARWRLVETAWAVGVSDSLIDYETDSGLLVRTVRRKPVASARDALNGYQKGRCFYCYRAIGTVPDVADLAEVDHFLPWTLEQKQQIPALDRVWNLVLSCQECNRGVGGKFHQVPDVRYLNRLSKRNEYLIASHHPLRETLMLQTGSNETMRRRFLQDTFDLARQLLAGGWVATAQADPTF